MATTTKGTAPCPECGSTQNVKHDGRKYFITCSECRTMTSYQASVAKTRIEQKLTPVDSKPEVLATVEVKEKAPKPPPIPARVTTTSFFDHLNELF